MNRRIYLASSWKNVEAVRGIAELLRMKGHEVFDFTDPTIRPKGMDNFAFEASLIAGRPREEIEWLEFLDWPATKRAFACDKAGLDWANTIVMILPCGRNAHLEAGYGVGQGKDVFIFGKLPKGEYEVMYRFATGCYRTEQFMDLVDRLKLTKLQAEESTQGVQNVGRSCPF